MTVGITEHAPAQLHISDDRGSAEEGSEPTESSHDVSEVAAAAADAPATLAQIREKF